MKNFNITLLTAIISSGFIANVMAATSDELPYTFTSGEAAKAAEVNANFEYLKARIEALENPTLEMSDLAGTYKCYSHASALRSDIYSGETVAFSSDPKAQIVNFLDLETMTLYSDGNYSSNGAEQYSLIGIDTYHEYDSNDSALYSDSVALYSDLYSSYLLNDGTETFSDSGTWSYSDHVMTITDEDGEYTFTVSKDGSIMIAHDVDEDDSDEITHSMEYGVTTCIKISDE